MLGIADALSSLTDAVEQAIDWLGAAVGNLIDWLGTAASDLVGWLGTAAGDLVGWLGGVIGWLGNAHEPVGEILAVLWPSMVVAILIVTLLRSARWLVLFWRGRTPRVQISPFAWTASEDGASEATWVTSLFREKLAELRLDALDPLPERAPGAPLVEIVEGVGQGVGRGLDIGKAVGRLFRAVWPDAAYEVWGSLRPLDRGRGRISVQLVGRRGGNKTLLNVALEETGWEDGARKAAMAVAGALYPRVRARDRDPWTLWKETVPRELMADYHDARKHEEANCLEQALDRYHAALDQDPLNPNLRLKIAMLQERLELDLDAWVTYEAIADESDPRAWRGPNRRVYLLAHYRMAILLGNGRVAEQWVKNDPQSECQRTKRDRERQDLRKELILSLESDLLEAERDFRTPEPRLASASAARLFTRLHEADGETEGAAATLRLFEPPSFETDAERQRRRQEIDAVLQVLSLWHLEELDAWLRARPPVRWRQWWDWWVHRPPATRILLRRELSRSAVRISKLVIRIRIGASLERHYLSSPTLASETTEEVRRTHQQLTRRWPFPPVDAWHHLTQWVAPRRRWNNRRDDAWQLHYNAACAAASVLRYESVLTRAEQDPGPGKALPDKVTREKVMARAIAELEDYAYRAGSQRVAAQADWLAIDDPDFEGLRKTPRFKLWASHHLPRGLPPKEPNRKSDVKRFTIRILHDGARAIASSWRERADDLDASAAEIWLWWRSERDAWETLRTSCREHLSWSERLRGLKALQGWLAETKRTEKIDFGYEPRSGTAKAATPGNHVFDELVALAGDRRPGKSEGAAVLPWVQSRVEEVRAAYENGEMRADARGILLADVERKEALKAFRIWTWLADALAAELNGATSNGSASSLRPRLDRIYEELSPARPAK